MILSHFSSKVVKYRIQVAIKMDNNRMEIVQKYLLSNFNKM